MSRIRVHVQRVVNAPADEVYAVFADYRVRHPRILPPENFVFYELVEGGYGAGTVVRIRIRAGGRERPYTLRVSEPTPGGLLLERDQDSSLETTFSLVPAFGGQQTRVTIETEWQGASGAGGFFERTFAPIAIRSIYNKEMDRLEAELRGTLAPAAAPGA
jgi:hypothetical protein